MEYIKEYITTKTDQFICQRIFEYIDDAYMREWKEEHIKKFRYVSYSILAHRCIKKIMNSILARCPLSFFNNRNGKIIIMKIVGCCPNYYKNWDKHVLTEAEKKRMPKEDLFLCNPNNIPKDQLYEIYDFILCGHKPLI